MKKKRGIYQIVMLVVLGLFVSLTSIAQAPPPPAGHGRNGNQSGGMAPVGEGILILLSMGIAYGSKKTYQLFREKQEDSE